MDLFSKKKSILNTDSVDNQIASLTENTRKQLQKGTNLLTDTISKGSDKLSQGTNLLTDSIADTGNTLQDSVKSLNSETVKPKPSFFLVILDTLRYILIFYIIIYIILVILNQNNLLPDFIKNIFEPLDIINILNGKKKEKIETPAKKKQKEELSKPLTSIEEPVEDKAESTPPQRLPQQGYPDPKPDIATNSTQSSKIAKKSGYCFIGEDRGFRSCVHVKKGDMCMSGDIFPKEAICINPNLRA